MPSSKKPIPEFQSEEERVFWACHDSTEFIDWSSAESRRFPNLKPALRTIFLAERLNEERLSRSTRK
jgi:hypothetical protein